MHPWHWQDIPAQFDSSQHQSKRRCCTGHSIIKNCSNLASGRKDYTLHIQDPIHLIPKEEQVCSIKKGSAMVILLKRFKVIVWDEATMSNKLALKAVECTFQEI